MSVSFLEATINELFADSVDNPWGPLKDLDVDARKLLAEMWSLRVPRTAKSGVLSMRGVLEKYEIARMLLRKPGFDVARSPYQELTSPHGSSRGILGLTTAHPASWASLTPSCRGPKPPPTSVNFRRPCGMWTGSHLTGNQSSAPFIPSPDGTPEGRGLLAQIDKHIGAVTQCDSSLST